MKPKNQAVFRVMGVEQGDPGGETNTQRTFSLYHIGLKQSFFFKLYPRWSALVFK